MYVSRRCLLFILSLILVFTASGCAYRTPIKIQPPVEPPEKYSIEGGNKPLPDRWWESFGDIHLNALVNECLDANLDLAQAWARLSQAQALARKTGAAKWPQLGFEASASRSRINIASFPPDTGTERDYIEQYNMGLAASYEIDLWGRINALDEAARLDMRSSRLDMETMAMSLATQVTQAWLSLIEQQAQLALIHSQQSSSRTQLDLVELRFSRGLASALDVFQQRQQLAAIEAQTPLLEAQIAILSHEINVLLARPPGTPLIGIPAALPQPWPLPDAGFPVYLLTRRPDVEASRLRVMAADERVGAAIAERFPRLSLSASSGYSAASLEDLLDQWIWSLAGSISATIFSGNAKNMEVRRTRAVVEERLAAYGTTVLSAVQEVEDALVREHSQREYITRLEKQVDLARHTFTEARQRYATGLSDYLSVLNALQSLQQAEREALSARAGLLSFRIQICRALGGTWTAQLSRTSTRGENL